MQLSCTRGNSRPKTLMEIKIKKRVLLEDEASDWLQIWKTASLLDVKDKKAIPVGFPKYCYIYLITFFSSYICYELDLNKHAKRIKIQVGEANIYCFSSDCSQNKLFPDTTRKSRESSFARYSVY